MAKEEKQIGITVKKEDDMPEWYSQVCQKAELADTSYIKGFMVIRPNAYSIWEQIQDYFNAVMKKKGVRNAYFPLLVPESFFKKEAEHAEGFAPELAWIEKSDGGEERLAIRPTSETIMYDSYSKWVRSYRDLPLRINQWCNILRWEVKQTKVFLRTREFLWQEGHCVYETEKQCDEDVIHFLNEYKKLCEEQLAVPVLIGTKTEKEKFAGAKYTTTVEAFMPDGKALQCGTSHNLGQGFAKGFGIRFKGKDEKEHVPWQSSWGFSTRLIGAIVMTHGDSKGAVMPPRIAKDKIVIVPIVFEKSKKQILDKAKELGRKLESFGAIVDDRDEYSAGWKYNEWEMKGIPLRIEVGPKDIEKEQVVIVRRDNGKKEFVKEKDLMKKVPEILEHMHKDMFSKAKKFLDNSIVETSDWKSFEKTIKDKKIAKSPFCGDIECEDWIKDKTGGATSRCIDMKAKKPKQKCVQCGKEAKHYVYFSKSY
jgi:prolyl-tRNA synthetase